MSNPFARPTLAVPDGVLVEQVEDFGRNGLKIRVTYEARTYEQFLTNEMLHRMQPEQMQTFIDSMCARVMSSASLVVMNSGMPEEDLPGGTVNYPVAFMAEGDYVEFEHPLFPGETFRVRFLYSRGPWTEVRLEWPGHGNVQMPAVRSANTIVREVIQEAMAMASVLMV